MQSEQKQKEGRKLCPAEKSWRSIRLGQESCSKVTALPQSECTAHGICGVMRSNQMQCVEMQPEIKWRGELWTQDTSKQGREGLAKVRPRQLLKTMSYSRLGTTKESTPAQMHLKSTPPPKKKNKRVAPLVQEDKTCGRWSYFLYILFRIPNIYQFWYTTMLFRPVKVHQKVREFLQNKIDIIGQKFRFLYAEKYTDFKKVDYRR